MQYKEEGASTRCRRVVAQVVAQQTSTPSPLSHYNSLVRTISGASKRKIEDTGRCIEIRHREEGVWEGVFEGHIVQRERWTAVGLWGLEDGERGVERIVEEEEDEGKGNGCRDEGIEGCPIHHSCKRDRTGLHDLLLSVQHSNQALLAVEMAPISFSLPGLYDFLSQTYPHAYQVTGHPFYVHCFLPFFMELDRCYHLRNEEEDWKSCLMEWNGCNRTEDHHAFDSMKPTLQELFSPLIRYRRLISHSLNSTLDPVCSWLLANMERQHVYNHLIPSSPSTQKHKHYRILERSLILAPKKENGRNSMMKRWRRVVDEEVTEVSETQLNSMPWCTRISNIRRNRGKWQVANVDETGTCSQTEPKFLRKRMESYTFHAGGDDRNQRPWEIFGHMWETTKYRTRGLVFVRADYEECHPLNHNLDTFAFAFAQHLPLPSEDILPRHESMIFLEPYFFLSTTATQL
ncbi:hypothetical protein FB446DRAFT_708769 [Lentinula raphanica]|nr:hypothetical protein FB446DRAFT_708769 [Lentinula raphanica]